MSYLVMSFPSLFTSITSRCPVSKLGVYLRREKPASCSSKHQFELLVIIMVSDKLSRPPHLRACSVPRRLWASPPLAFLYSLLWAHLFFLLNKHRN